MSERVRWHFGRFAICAVLGLAFILAGFVFINQSRAVAEIKRDSGQYQFARLAVPGGRQRAVTPSPVDMEVALRAAPINPAVVNAAIFAEAARSATGKVAVDKLPLLRSIGWRSTVALQNTVFLAVEQRDLGLIANVADALLRRQEIEEEATALMRLMELAPQTRRILVTKLTANPVWRYPYFRLGGLEGKQQAVARGRLVKDMAAAGSPLNRGEIYSTLRMLIGAQQVDTAYDLWRAYRKVKAQPLGDPEFEWAYIMRSDPDQAMPFEWVLPSGSGYWSEVLRQDDDRAAIAINWDGKGAPQLLAQQTALRPAAYQLVLTGQDIPPDILQTFAFSLRCPTGRVIFDKIVSQTRNRVTASSPEMLGCNAPVFEVSGRPKESLAAQALGQSGIAVAYHLVLDRIELR